MTHTTTSRKVADMPVSVRGQRPGLARLTAPGGCAASQSRPLYPLSGPSSTVFRSTEISRKSLGFRHDSCAESLKNPAALTSP